MFNALPLILSSVISSRHAAVGSEISIVSKPVSQSRRSQAGSVTQPHQQVGLVSTLYHHRAWYTHWPVTDSSSWKATKVELTRNIWNPLLSPLPAATSILVWFMAPPPVGSLILTTLTLSFFVHDFNSLSGIQLGSALSPPSFSFIHSPTLRTTRWVLSLVPGYRDKWIRFRWGEPAGT